jgi:hypothetical protein
VVVPPERRRHPIDRLCEPAGERRPEGAPCDAVVALVVGQEPVHELIGDVVQMDVQRRPGAATRVLNPVRSGVRRDQVTAMPAHDVFGQERQPIEIVGACDVRARDGVLLKQTLVVRNAIEASIEHDAQSSPLIGGSLVNRPRSTVVNQ